MPQPSRTTLFKNLLLLKSAYTLAQHFPNIRFILIKGAALLTISTNKDTQKIFYRPMEDVDVVADVGGEKGYEIFISNLYNGNDMWQKIHSDPQSFYFKQNSPIGNSAHPFMSIIDIHKNLWYAPDEKINKEIINRSQRISDEDAPSNLFRLSPEDLWIDIAIHSSFHHTLKPADRKEDINYLESVFQIDKDVIQERLKRYFSRDIAQAILENFREEIKTPTKKCQLYKKFISSGFPAKGFIARYFFVSKKPIQKMSFIFTELLFPPERFIAHRYDVSHPLKILLYRLARPFILTLKGICALTHLITQNLTAFKRPQKQLLKNNP